MANYHAFRDEDGNESGSFEVFYVREGEQSEDLPGVGWYWWACFPGCLPDGEPTGPFETEADAIADAQGDA